MINYTFLVLLFIIEIRYLRGKNVIDINIITLLVSQYHFWITLNFTNID